MNLQLYVACDSAYYILIIIMITIFVTIIRINYCELSL